MTAKIFVILSVIFSLTVVAAREDFPKNTVHFTDIEGSLPAGCAQDYQPFGDSGMGYVVGKNVLSVFLSELPIDEDGEHYTFAIGVRGVDVPKAGDVIKLDQLAFTSGIEYNCKFTNPISIWIVRDGELIINDINTTIGTASYTITAHMMPSEINDSDATFTLNFDGTTRFFSGPSNEE